MYLDSSLLVLAFFIVSVVFYFIKEESNKKDELLKNKDDQLFSLQKRINDIISELQKFKNEEIQTINETALSKAVLELESWKIDNENVIRKDAVKRSKAVTIGKISEHVIPFYSNEFHFNPKDVRFIGSPIDLIVFHGLEDDSKEIEVYILEVKTGHSTLSAKQKLIKDAIEKKRVFWKDIRLKGA